MTEMALMFADRAQAIAEVIEPALAAGRIVLCDRFTDSTEAYQGGGRELGSERVLDLHRLVCGDLQPDLTLLLLPSLESSLARARHRNERTTAQTGQDENRFEQEQDEFFKRVWEKYREIARREPRPRRPHRRQPQHRRSPRADRRSRLRTPGRANAPRLKPRSVADCRIRCHPERIRGAPTRIS